MSLPSHIEDFYDVSAEVLSTLYATFPMRQLLLVEDLRGPIQWDMTGLPDKRSRACFEALVWLADHEFMTYRSVEPRDVGIEGAVLTQKAFVLLTSTVQWSDGTSSSRIDALRAARRAKAYSDYAVLIQDMLAANCSWHAPQAARVLEKSSPPSVSIDEDN